MGEFLGELLGDLIIKPLMATIGYGTGVPLVLFFSLGMLHTTLDEPSKQEQRGMRWYSVTFVRNRKRYLIRTFTILVGIVFWGLFVAMLVLGKR